MEKVFLKVMVLLALPYQELCLTLECRKLFVLIYY
jgi:hypothetical protein